jgi:transposase
MPPGPRRGNRFTEPSLLIRVLTTWRSVASPRCGDSAAARKSAAGSSTETDGMDSSGRLDLTVRYRRQSRPQPKEPTHVQGTIAVDLAKSVFQLVVAEESGRISARKRLTRTQFFRFWENRAPCRVLMEACGSAHFWGRFLQSRGFDVVLLPAHSVTPYVQRGKTDERDAEGLPEAVKSPRVHPVAIKSCDQQGILALHRARQQWQGTRTARINAMRGFLREFGVLCAKGSGTFLRALPLLLEEHREALPDRLRSLLREMHEEVLRMEKRMEVVKKELEAIAKQNPTVASLLRVPGVGVLTATAMYASIGNIHLFRSARHLASWLGITPKEHSTGSKRRLGRISKQGATYLRTLLIPPPAPLSAPPWIARARAGNSATSNGGRSNEQTRCT